MNIWKSIHCVDGVFVVSSSFSLKTPPLRTFPCVLIHVRRVSLGPWVLNLSQPHRHQEGCAHKGWPHSRVSDLVGLGWDLRILISDQLWGEGTLEAAGPGGHALRTVSLGCITRIVITESFDVLIFIFTRWSNYLPKSPYPFTASLAVCACFDHSSSLSTLVRARDLSFCQSVRNDLLFGF